MVEKAWGEDVSSKVIKIKEAIGWRREKIEDILERREDKIKEVSWVPAIS